MPGLAAPLRNTVALLLAGAACASAQPLPPRPYGAEPLRAPDRPLLITQFGMPGEQQFVFCADSDCPQPSRKQRSAALPAPPLPAALALPLQEPARALAAPAPVPVARALARQPRHDKPRARRGCADRR